MDLSGASFTWLLGAIGSTAWSLFQAQEKYLPKPPGFPVTWMRRQLRTALETSPLHFLPSADIAEGKFKDAARAALDQLVAALRQRSETELLLGFPSAPFILPLAADDHSRFLQYAEARPDHAVRFKRRGSGTVAEWTLAPVEAPGSYELAFKLPKHIEQWISDIDGKERRRTMEIKEQFLSAITIYRMNGEGLRTYQLRYEASSLSRF